ncbi:MAG: NADP-dependent oxidoreductase [Hyphomicrobium sp.]|nr:NADP-dependent oxidoreductase [Hyphomicrobium sp.]
MKQPKPALNERVILVSRPVGIAQSSDFAIEEAALPPLQDGEVCVANQFLSVDPAMRGWIADSGNYSDPVPIGGVMRSLAVGKIVESRSPDWRTGQIVLGWFGWQKFATVKPEAIVRAVTQTDLPASLALGVLGINGITALLALTLVGEPKPGDALVVSTAAGSVGSAVGQIGRLFGCRTVGIAGGADKVQQCLKEFGYDAAIDYKAGPLDAAIAQACPDGVEIYFDNTSGAVSDAVLQHLALGARVVNCGTAAIDRWSPWPTGPRVERHLLVKRARMQGFVVFDHMDKWEESVEKLAQWVRDGKLRYSEEFLDGLESCPDALAGLYRGENFGKRIIRL